MDKVGPLSDKGIACKASVLGAVCVYTQEETKLLGLIECANVHIDTFTPLSTPQYAFHTWPSTFIHGVCSYPDINLVLCNLGKYVFILDKESGTDQRNNSNPSLAWSSGV